MKFLITGHGRSGTKWLAAILNSADLKVVHEAHSPFDVAGYASTYRSPVTARYFVQARSRIMDKNIGEVNSHLRYCVPEIKSVLRTPVVGVIRNGPDVVRSMMFRRTKPPIPTPRGTIESLSFYWAETYRILADNDVKIFRLEDLTSDWPSYHALCKSVGVKPKYEKWKAMRDKRINASGAGSIALDPFELKEFNTYAGDVQEKYYGGTLP